MKDNFDLKKFLKENKTIENSNKYLANSITEGDKKDALRSKVREMILKEMNKSTLDATGNFYYDNSNPDVAHTNLDGTGGLTSDGRKIPNLTTQDDYALDSNQYGEEIKGMSPEYALSYLTDQGLEQGEAVNVISQYIDSIGDEVRGEFSNNRVVDYKDDLSEAEEEIEDDESETEEGEDGVEVVDDSEFDETEDTEEGGGDESGIMAHLEAAMESARELGDEKLMDQLGNTITFYTRQHIAK